jgi:hypothetical protein
MVRITKFQTSSFRMGPLEGPILYRIMFVTFILGIAVFFLGLEGLLVLAILPVFIIRIQQDYIDEFIMKKVRGIDVPTLLAFYSSAKGYFEVFGTNYGLSESQDIAILDSWSSVIGAFSEDITIIRHPYRIPLQRFEIGRKEYDSLFSGLNLHADAYFVVVDSRRVKEFEETLASSGISFRELDGEEVKILNDLI